MKTVSLSGSFRESVGKKDAKKQRKQGKVPCVLYGGAKQIHFVAEEKSFKNIIFTPDVHIIDLTINDKNFTVILQDIQYHPVNDNILHVDFLEIMPGKQVTIAIPIILKGNAIGVLNGGRLVKKIRKIRVNALIEDLPDQIVIDISKLKIGDSIRVSDMDNDKLSFLDNASSMIVAVFTARAVEVEEEEEEGEEGEEGEESTEGADGKEGTPPPAEEQKSK